MGHTTFVFAIFSKTGFVDDIDIDVLIITMENMPAVTAYSQIKQATILGQKTAVDRYVVSK